MSHTKLLLCLIGIFAAFFSHVEARLEGEGIIGGDDAKDGQFPYQISLELEGVSICGGSILNDRFVITAAHCVIGENDIFTGHPLKVVAGISDLTSRSNSRVAVDVVQVYVPGDYNATKENHSTSRSTGDIAILKLSRSLGIRGNSRLGTVQLPRSGETYEGKEATVSGFGYNYVDVVVDYVNNEAEEVNGVTNGKMRFAKANVLSYDECQDIFSPKLPIEKSHLCAVVLQRDEDEPEGVCSGDSGGPLVYNGVQIGVVSTSPAGCVEYEEPGVYTRVSDYIHFIKSVVTGRFDESIRTTTLRVLPERWG